MSDQFQGSHVVCGKNGPSQNGKIGELLRKSSPLKLQLEQQLNFLNKERIPARLRTPATLQPSNEHCKGTGRKLVLPGRGVRLKPPAASSALKESKESKPLVDLDSEDSDTSVEFTRSHNMSKSGCSKLTQELILEGYKLSVPADEEDEDLDLIPPSSHRHHHSSCFSCLRHASLSPSSPRRGACCDIQ